jgi:polysaccharide export outer membrane protein
MILIIPGSILRTILICFYSVLVIYLFCSCNAYKNIPYFADFPDTALKTSVKTIPFKSPIIKPDDLLSITIETVDADITRILNSANNTLQTSNIPSSSNQQTIPGYLVDKNGEVELPFIGRIKLEGYTTIQARDTITEAISKYIKNPIVNIKFANFKVTVLGEVLKPATYIMPTEKVTVFDALGQAGDLTIYGRREDVLVIRDTLNNQKNMVHLNLNSKNIMSSPYFYLQPNDVVYVEPNKSKAASTDAARNRMITITASVVSLLIVFFARVKL